MREVSSFVVVFPARLAVQPVERKRALLDALRRWYPHYTFQSMDGRALQEEDDFTVIPVVGTAGEEAREPDRVYLCRPLDPRVIPDLTQALKELELTAAALN